MIIRVRIVRFSHLHTFPTSHLLSFVICYLSSAICRLTSFIDSFYRPYSLSRKLRRELLSWLSRDDRTDIHRRRRLPHPRPVQCRCYPRSSQPPHRRQCRWQRHSGCAVRLLSLSFHSERSASNFMNKREFNAFYGSAIAPKEHINGV